MRKTNPIFKRLDRGWVNPEWMTFIPNSNLQNLPRVTSDHCPQLIHLDNPIPRLRNESFRFEPMLLLDNVFKENIGNTWPMGGGEIGPNLQEMQHVLTAWNLNNFGNVYKRKRRALSRLKVTQKAFQTKPHSQFLHNLEIELRSEIVNILMQEEALWAVKNKMDRIKDGERNTSFFHRSVMIKRSTSQILSIRNEVGVDIQEPYQIRKHISDFFHTSNSSNQMECNWT